MSQTQASNQVGGDHYKNCSIDPATYNEENFPGWWAGNVVKYVTRYTDKNGLEDCGKAVHYIEMIMRKYYGKELVWSIEEPTNYAQEG